jgi:prolyl oligopeptidase
MSLRSLISALTCCAIAAPAACEPVASPPVRDVTETFFGIEVHDPYRYLEDVKSPEVQAWMKSASDGAALALARIPGRQAMLERIASYDAAVSARVGNVVRETGDLWFYQRRGASENQFKLLVRRGLKGSERVLVDPEAIEKQTGKPHAINYFSTAPGGRYVADGLSAQELQASADVFSFFLWQMDVDGYQPKQVSREARQDQPAVRSPSWMSSISDRASSPSSLCNA